MKNILPLIICLSIYSCQGDQNTAGSPVVEEWTMKTEDNCGIYIKEIGDGKPVLVIHGGWGSEHGYMLDGLKDLSQSHRLIFYDQRVPCARVAIRTASLAFKTTCAISRKSKPN